MSDTEIKLQNCTTNIEELQRKLQEELAKKEELKLCAEAERKKALSSLDEKIKIIEAAMDGINIGYKIKKLQHYLKISQFIGTFNTLMDKTSARWDRRIYLSSHIKRLPTDEITKVYGEIINTKEFNDLLTGNYYDAQEERSRQYYPRQQEAFKKSVSSYEKDIAVFDSLKIISQRLDKIEAKLGL